MAGLQALGRGVLAPLSRLTASVQRLEQGDLEHVLEVQGGDELAQLADAFNAMTTDRSYRKALPLAVAVQEMRDNAGTQFDPRVVEALLEVVGDPGWELALAPAPERVRAPQTAA